jgi:hypothetical protein
MTGKSKDIIFLVGAGASVEADIPASGMMINKIESLLKKHGEWKPFLDLYHHIKSSIYYSAGLKGLFETAVPYNIETLVHTLEELERNEQHPLYPFISAWNSRFVTLAGESFSKVQAFRRLILRQLKNWVVPDDPGAADYYNGFVQLQSDLNFSLRIFSLNYDLCLERLNSREFRVETGFGGVGPRYFWDWERFEDSDTGPPPPQVYLYKLHGSINWKRDETKNLFCLEQTESIQPEDMELIFGRDFKMEAADPYLFYAYEFRKFSLMARLIIVIGYGFGDEHINKILSQALNADGDRRLFIISDCENTDTKKQKQAEVMKCLGAKAKQIVVNEGKAKKFLLSNNLATQLLDLIPGSTDVPF